MEIPAGAIMTYLNEPLINILIYTIAVIGLFSVTWLYYVAVMSLKVKYKSLPIESKVLAMIHLPIGLILDFCLNVLMSPLFLEPPLELTLSARLKRHRERSRGFRLRIADYICQNLLNPFEQNHC